MDVLYGPDFKINENTAVAIGKFDGLHAGHRYILNKLMQEAENNNLKSTVYTFSQNPQIVLKREMFTPLMENEEKTEEIEKLGIDYLVYENFNEKFADLLPEEFVQEILIKKMSAKVVVVGENFNFGKNNEGNIGTMKALGKKFGFRVECVKLLCDNGQIISSSRLRQDILNKIVK